MEQENAFIQHDSAIVIAGKPFPTHLLIELVWVNDERGIGWLPLSIKQLDKKSIATVELTEFVKTNHKLGAFINGIIENHGYTFEPVPEPTRA